MIVSEPWWLFPSAIAASDCDRIVELGLSNGVARGGGRKSDLEGKRESEVAWIEDDWVYDLVEPYVHAANQQAGWRFQLERMLPLQFGVYPVGGHYTWHFDTFGRPYGPGDPPHEIFHGLMRKLSFTVQLSDPASYDGGLLEVELGLPDTVDRAEATDRERKRGTVIVFPSFMPHRVTPVTRGVRYSLVGWFCGPPFT